ncbi:hypothetical protein GCM10023210_06290 [Chryseobacterium ginsengisoli]|uniref:DUF4145 domain-containing protein n=1 Tax=Chryseobacterium ginsengisoli TaxID=363853 RepID=A0ABP9LU73_9FLAO
MQIEDYIDSLDDFDGLSAKEKIKYVAYFYLISQNVDNFKSSDLLNVFRTLHLTTPNSIPQIISNNCSGTSPLFIKKEEGYAFNRSIRKKLDDEFNLKPLKVTLTNNLFPLELLNNTRGYIEKIGNQAIFCYDYGQYDASLVMIRKLLETLIIEIFEKFKIPNEIKDSDGNFYMLAQLVDNLISNSNWNLGRTTKQYLPKIKKLADTSAHNRRFNAKKSDIDQYKNELRMIIEELLLIVNF